MVLAGVAAMICKGAMLVEAVRVFANVESIETVRGLTLVGLQPHSSSGRRRREAPP
jgi:hypothetical protein